MEIKNRHTKTVYRVFWGILFLLAGAAIILKLIGVLVIPNGIGLGDLIWSIVLALVFIWSVLHRFWFFTFLTLVGAGYLWRAQLGLPHMNFWLVIGAALLLSIGLSILFRPKRKYNWQYKYVGRSVKNEDASFTPTPAENGAQSSGGIHTSASEDDNNVFIKASFGATVKYVSAQALKHARLDCSFGSIKAFFDNASVHENGAVIEIDNSFGGVELYIPKEWRLTDDISRTLGCVDVKNPERERASGPPVTLTGSVKFGGIQIIYV